MTTYKRGEELFCPHCGEGEGMPVEDYVPPRDSSRGLEEEEEQCVHCDYWFFVQEKENGTFEVWD